MSANPYYPVTTVSDSAHLTDDDWGLSFTNEKRARVSRVKSLCQKTQDRPKCVIAGTIAVIIFLVICVVIIVAAKKADSGSVSNPTGNEPARVVNHQGLNFYPVSESGTILLKFAPHMFHNDEPIKQSLDKAVRTYERLNQQGNVYADCDSAYAPFNKTCRYTKFLFGPHCTSHMDYGYRHGQACVLLTLDLPANVTIDQIPADSLLRKGVDVPEPIFTHSIPVTCRGTTPKDHQIFVMMTKATHSRVEVFPVDGFKSYFFRPRNTSIPFLTPAVMVWFPSLPNRHVLHITCTAWGQLYDAQKNMVPHPLLQTTFAFFQEFGKAD